MEREGEEGGGGGREIGDKERIGYQYNEEIGGRSVTWGNVGTIAQHPMVVSRYYNRGVYSTPYASGPRRSRNENITALAYCFMGF